jgi:hypothetical protein
MSGHVIIVARMRRGISHTCEMRKTEAASSYRFVKCSGLDRLDGSPFLQRLIYEYFFLGTPELLIINRLDVGN